MSKACRGCGITKPHHDFYTHPMMADGRLNFCKECVKARVNQHRKDNIEEIREYDRQRGGLPHRVAARKAYAKTDRGKERLAAGAKAWQQRNESKRAAHVVVGNRLRDGQIARPDTCEECGAQKPLHAHHDDYSKPLDVRFVCVDCHTAIHKEMRAMQRAERQMQGTAP